MSTTNDNAVGQVATAAERSIVTREAVFAECERLTAAGVKPSVRKLIHTLGGSATTVGAFLREWRAKQEIKAEEPTEEVELPAVVLEAAAQSAKVIWQVCRADSKREIDRVTEDANQQVREVVASRDEIERDLDESEADLRVARARLDEQDTELVKLRQVVAQAASIEAGLKATVDQMTRQIEAQSEEMKRVHAESEAARDGHAADIARSTADFARQLGEQAEATRRAQAETDSVRGKLEEQAAEHHQALERERIATVEVARAQGEITRLTAQRDQLEGDIRKAGQIDTELRAELAALMLQRNEASADRDEIRQQLDLARDQVATLTAQHEAAGVERDSIRQQLESARNQMAALDGQRNEAQTAAVRAREESAALRGQVDALREQNTQLLQTLKPSTSKKQ